MSTIVCVYDVHLFKLFFLPVICSGFSFLKYGALLIAFKIVMPLHLNFIWHNWVGLIWFSYSATRFLLV